MERLRVVREAPMVDVRKETVEVMRYVELRDDALLAPDQALAHINKEKQLDAEISRLPEVRALAEEELRLWNLFTREGGAKNNVRTLYPKR